jgi:hypothetical protein
MAKKAKYVGEMRYRLSVLNAAGVKFTSTGSVRDLDGTKRLALSILKTVRGAAFVEISSVGNSLVVLDTVTLDSEVAEQYG